jgi:hypothetical protein
LRPPRLITISPAHGPRRIDPSDDANVAVHQYRGSWPSRAPS